MKSKKIFSTILAISLIIGSMPMNLLKSNIVSAEEKRVEETANNPIGGDVSEFLQPLDVQLMAAPKVSDRSYHNYSNYFNN